MDEKRDISFWNNVEKGFSEASSISDIESSSVDNRYVLILERYKSLLGNKDVSLQTFRKILSESQVKESNSLFPQITEISHRLVSKEVDIIYPLLENNSQVAQDYLKELTGLDEEIIVSEISGITISKEGLMNFLLDNMLANNVIEQSVILYKTLQTKKIINSFPQEPLPQNKKTGFWESAFLVSDNLDDIGEGIAEATDVTKLLDLIFAVDHPDRYGFKGGSSLFRDGVEGKNEKTVQTLKFLQKLFVDEKGPESFFSTLLELEGKSSEEPQSLVNNLHEVFSLEGVNSAEDKQIRIRTIKEKILNTLKLMKEQQLIDFDIPTSIEDINLSSEVMQYLLIKAQELVDNSP